MPKRSAKYKIECSDKNIGKNEQKQRQQCRRMARVLESLDSDLGYDKNAGNSKYHLCLPISDVPIHVITNVILLSAKS